MIGERIRLAREACQLTQKELAQVANISQSAISAFEAGRLLEPSAEAIEQISAATAFPVRFFFGGPLPDLPDGHYRRLASGTSKVDKQVRAQVRQIVELVQRAESKLRLPPVRLDPLGRRDQLTTETLEQVARDARRAIGVGHRDPIPNVIRAAERSGVIVVRLPNEMADHDGFSTWPDLGMDGRPVLAIVGAHSGDRDRFTVAHELGHLLLHSVRHVSEPKTAEAEANRLAGALLVPLEAAREVLVRPITLRRLMELKATFGISIAAGAQRARDLELITPEQFVSLRKQLSARRWLHSEPISVEPERPMLIAKILDSLAGHGTTAQRAERVGMPIFVFRSFVPS
jgi:Zn-dependent peptidase ImmA (M78 family)/transcriptional regulator with XRE-family HTH domain